MPSTDREGSRDRELVLRHQPSFSDSGRLPMWDSSDPERAPPPLPLNPGSPSITTRPNTSATVAAAAAALSERARESAGASNYTTNPMPSKGEASPERSLIKGHHHKRMQSLQNGVNNVRDLSSYLTGGGKSPERSPEKTLSRSNTPSFASRFENDRSPERSPTRSGSPAPRGGDSEKATPTARPSARQPPRSILGENTPPQSSTMLALQTMPSSGNLDAALSNITNSSSVIRTPQTFDAISTQILSLTSIATNLQREMAQLSRRSKDNATDLVSLKEATNARDEDIRMSLRELVSNLSAGLLGSSGDGSRGNSHRGERGETFLLDNKPHAPQPTTKKAFALPRIPSPNSFAATIEREIANSPSPYSLDGAASLALLEKVLREMGTKEGQERLLSSLSGIVEKMNEDGSQTAQKLEEVVDFCKKISGSQAISDAVGIRNGTGTTSGKGNGGGDGPPKLVLDFEDTNLGALTRVSRDVKTQQDVTPTIPAPIMDGEGRKPYSSPRAADFVGGDMLKLLRKLKDSSTETGGLTAEVKALVRELRGEVLGMGRELGRKLEEVDTSRGQEVAQEEGPGREELAKIVQEGLAELREHMDRVIREKRRQSSSSTISRSTVDNQEIYQAIKHALSELPPQQQVAVQAPHSGLGKEDILDAVRDAWEAYKPEMPEIEVFGLERDEILQCLKEGLEEYRPQQGVSRGMETVNRDDVLDAVREGLQHFTPPAPVETEASITREEILMAVRECLESFEFPFAVRAESRDAEITRDAVVDAVREGLASGSGRELEINRDDLFDAVKAGLEGAPTPMGGLGEQVLDRLREVVEGMRTEFKQYSAANGRDTEQVLDAVKDGLESLRADIETYVDRAADVTGKDEIIDTVRDGLEHLRADVENYVANTPREGDPESGNLILDAMRGEFEHLRETMGMMPRDRDAGATTEMLDAIRGEFDHLRETIGTSIVPVATSDNREEILQAIREGLDEYQTNNSRNGDTAASAEILDVMTGEFEHLRETIATNIVRGGANLDKDEIIDTIKDVLGNLHTEVARGGDFQASDQVIDAMKEEFEHLRETMATTIVKGGASADKDEIVEFMRDGLDSLRADFERANDRPESVLSNTGELLDALADGLDALRSDVEKMVNKPLDMTVSYEILDTLKDGLAGVRADIDRLHEVRSEETALNTRGGEMVIGGELPATDGLKRDDIENLEVLITQLRIKVEALESMPPIAPPPPPVPQPVEGSLVKEDLDIIEELLQDVRVAVKSIALRERSNEDDVVTKEDTDAIETLLQNTKAKIDDIVFPDPETLAKRDHLDAVETIVKETRDAVEAFHERMDTDAATKEDINVMKGLLKDVRISLEEIRNKAPPEEDGERVTKTDVDALELLCADMKVAIDQLNLPDPDILPTRTDVEMLGTLLTEHKAKVDVGHELTVKAFEDRRIEHEEVKKDLGSVRTFLEDVKDELKSQLEENNNGVEELNKLVEGLGETLGANSNVSADIKEVLEAINRESARAQGEVEGLKYDSDEKTTTIMEKTEEHRTAVVAELSRKIDTRFDDLMIRYDDAQLAAEQKARAAEEKDAHKDETLYSTKAVAEDLKLLIDTLGTTVTETCDRIGDDSKTVFGRVDETFLKVEDSHSEAKSEHSKTHDENFKTLTAVEGLQAHVSIYHPKILDSIKDVLSIVGQHYEHSQKYAEESKVKVIIPDPTPAPAPAPVLPPPLLQDMPEKYDDAEVHTKLDKLLNHSNDTDKSFAQIDLLDQIHQQVMTTAAEVSNFVASQTKLISENHEDRERQAEEAAIALEKRLAQKERVESEVVDLSSEKDLLNAAVAALKAEKEGLSAEKMHMAADVSSLETALKIRREELHFMEARAEALERRIVEGVLDHSRSVLISRPSKDTSNMSLKRVPSHASTITTGTAAPSIMSSAMGMALKSRRPARANPAGSKTAGRRILSLNQIAGNATAGSQALIVAPLGKGLGNLKRSHSVKSNYMRQSSWGGRSRLEAANKENEIFDEEGSGRDGEGSDTGTERRTSYGTSNLTDTNRRSSYGTSTGVDTERKSSYGTTNGTVSDHRTSFGTTNGTLGEKSMIEEEAEEEAVEEHEEELREEEEKADQLVPHHEMERGKGNAGEVVIFEAPSDSGIGTEMPTAVLMSVNGSDYFDFAKGRE
ncbi:MAG: hypothetical protein M1827_005292 [Pycnora praestabilis]|nr:MAG: hypothetical protein M1827_005292 [Pycnora praestabilis]